MKTCKKCIYSRKIIPRNTNCPAEFVCSLSDEDFHDCISNDMWHFSSKEKDKMYPQKLLRTLEDRFDQLQAYLFRSFDGEEDDLYSFIASIIYDKDYEDCREFNSDGTPNPEGKELRERAKQFILPVVVECGGISDDEVIQNE